MPRMTGGFDQFSLRELFRVEASAQAQALVAGLLALEQEPHRADQLEACMRAAHSLKGAARLVDIGAGVIVAHAMEELFVAAQEGRVTLSQAQIDVLLNGVDLITRIGDAPPPPEGEDDLWEEAAEDYVVALTRALGQPEGVRPDRQHEHPVVDLPEIKLPSTDESAERSMRISAENLNRMLDLAGETLVNARRLTPIAGSLQRLKQLQKQAARSIEALRESLQPQALTPQSQAALSDAERAMLACRHFLTDRMAELEALDHQSTSLTHRLYDQALKVRMRPFSEGVTGFPRMVRDIGNSLGKRVRLEIAGAATRVDRDILERLEAPLGHLLRNAVDHGIEMPGVRIGQGKAEEGMVRVEAHHNAGALQILVSDDGAGIDVELIRARVAERRLADEQTAARLSESELLEFLFLPGFTMKQEVSELSGRGVGLDVVRDMLKQVGGKVTITSALGEGTTFQLRLPLTLSVIRALLVEIGGEPYAFSFGQIVRATKIPTTAVSTVEGRQLFDLDGEQVGLVAAHQILGHDILPASGETLSVVILTGPEGTYGVMVDRFLGARELVVQPLDPRLGKIKDISAGALMEDGTPLLIIDAEDMVQTMVKLAMSDRLNAVQQAGTDIAARSPRRRVLVVDDSFTVRELQRKLLEQSGYDVELAVDGMEGWNLVRSGQFDLVVTDVDMPRMDGIELVRLIKHDAKLRGTPVMILSYKDREDDRMRGLQAGADYYLTKGSYQNDALIEAVVDLIGPGQP